MSSEKFSRSQMFTLFIVACVNFFCACCISLQAPFYPAEAEKKGATATEYGLVFGSFELVGFLTSPLFGKIVDRVGAKSLLGIGLTVSSVATILFGFLDVVWNRALFISLSFVLRIIESLGATAAVVSGFALLGIMFPENVATIFATLETFYGSGYIVGPTLGGILYNLGGFILPFAFMGVFTAIVSLSILLFIPDVTVGAKSIRQEGALLTAFKNSSIAIDAVSVSVFATSSGFYSATLEPHIREYGLSPVLTGFMFIISGGTYAVVSPIFGRIVDKHIKAKTMLILGCALNIVSFSIMGPLPCLPIPSTLATCIVALFIHGFALAAGNVATFIDSIRSALNSGFPDNISTYAIMSGIWTSAYALGAFIGPSVGGVLYDLVGFQKATIFVIAAHAALALVIIWYLVTGKDKKDNIRINLLTEIDEDAELAKSATSCSITSTCSDTKVANGHCKNYSYGTL